MNIGLETLSRQLFLCYFDDIFNMCRSLDRLHRHQDNMSVWLYPLTPHFYIVKLGLTGVYIIFLFLL